ncbi:phage major capsid protein [Achromobacter sp. UBA2119]|uniref:phage major capsid protein n=1 Tax=Achromobacter sp. UBA2119 TaxID=1945911 RepID=UPI00257EE585|nr:phage major capsid protein [Achromobacter sp. UBA2119]
MQSNLSEQGALMGAVAGAMGEMARKSGGAGNDPERLEIKSLLEDLAKRDETIKKFAEKAGEEIKTLGKISAETKSALEKFASDGLEVQQRLFDLEQKMARRGAAEQPQVKTWGEVVAESDGYKSVAEGRAARSGRIAVKAVTSTVTSAGVMVPADRLPGVVVAPLRELVVRDLLLPGRTTSNSVEYVREDVFTNNAAAVAEGAQKPESDITFELANAGVKTIAHWIPASKQILDDAPQLQSYIDMRMLYGLQLKEEQQILLGDGTGANMLGIIPQAAAYQVARNKDGDTMIDVVRHALLQVRLSLYRPSAIIMHPEEWEAIELTKDKNGNYIWSNPTLYNGKNLWGYPVVESMAMAPGDFLVGAFNAGAQLFDREDATVEISAEDRDNFIKNMLTIRAEERAALAVYRPASFVHGTFPSTAVAPPSGE